MRKNRRMIRPFDDGNWFPIYNAVFDVIMPRLSPNGWKVLCVVIRQTLGWRDPDSDDPRDRKEWDHIPYSQFREKCGIASDTTVKHAIDDCIEHNCLLRRQPLDKNGNPRMYCGKPYYEYSLNRDYELATTDSVEVTATDSVEVDAPMATETVDPKQSYKQTGKQVGAVPTAHPPSCFPDLFNTSISDIQRMRFTWTEWDEILQAEKSCGGETRGERTRVKLVRWLEKRLYGSEHPAIQIYHEEMELFPRKNQFSDIIERVGTRRLDFWREVVRAWKLHGWRPHNLFGMLECFEENRIPGKGGNDGSRWSRSGSGDHGWGVRPVGKWTREEAEELARKAAEELGEEWDWD